MTSAAKAKELESVLRGYERWEANLLQCDAAWEGALPTLTDELWQELLDLQSRRNRVLRGTSDDE